MKVNKNFIPLGGNKYTIDLDKVIEICTQQGNLIKEQEITNVLEYDDEKDEMVPTSRVERSLSNNANSHVPEISWNMMKIFVEKVLSETNDITKSDNTGAILSFNTLLDNDIIKIIENAK